MASMTRRDFLHDSAALAALLAGSAFLRGTAAEAAPKKRRKGDANDTLHVAIIGVNGRGREHVHGLARKYDRICQTGTQSRSQIGMREAMDFLRSEKIGKIKVARGLCYKWRPSIGKVSGPQPVPPSVNYDLWCGPAPDKPLLRKHLHY